MATIYTVRFLNYDGELLKEEQVEEGNSATPPEVPEYILTSEETYIGFTGWDKPYDNITSNLEINAIYASGYIVEFLDYDNTIIDTKFVLNGKSIDIQHPIRNGYMFTGWLPEPTNVTANIQVIAQYLDKKNALTELFKHSCEKNLIIEFYDNQKYRLTNDDFVAESLQISESISEGQQLRFGKCNANELRIEIFRTDINFKNKELQVKLYIPAIQDYLYLGTYYVVSDKFSSDRSYKTIIAYDKMYRLNNSDATSIYQGLFNLGYAPTIKQLRDTLFKQFSIGQPNVKLPLDTLSLNMKSGISLSGQQLIEAICEANGCFGKFDLNGSFRYIFLKSDFENPDYNLTINDYYSTTQEDYYVKKISRIQIVNGDIVGHSDGDNTNLYSIKNNILFTGKTEEELNAIANIIYNQIKDVNYCPFTMEIYCQPWLEVGDSVKVTTFDNTFNSIVLNRVVNGIIGIRDSYTSKGKEYYEDELNSSTKKTEDAAQKAQEAYDLGEQVNQDFNEFKQDYEDNGLRAFSVAELPDSPRPNSIYFIQGTAG